MKEEVRCTKWSSKIVQIEDKMKGAQLINFTVLLRKFRPRRQETPTIDQV